MTKLTEVRRELRRLADPARAATLARFFQTQPGGYGEGDRFLGLRVPQVRTVVRSCHTLDRQAVTELLRSPWHEERLLALLILVEQYRRGSEADRDDIHRTYLAHTRFINNWDLVDVSAEHIVGAHLDPADLQLLERLAASSSIWERRIAMLATFHWIRKGRVAPALHVARLLLNDREDLIHKAVGWMLREAHRRDPEAVERFLRRHYRSMPRTMLRYAIERFPPEKRQRYLKGAA
ncbi:MAG: DNA alkylation repair protein [Acidobacteriota bacterium]|jgi:3-methyladenine DNA glycosylase AlkD|nr:MAG: DNA alkylation repair protein [Acidobacteriota bacterium]